MGLDVLVQHALPKEGTYVRTCTRSDHFILGIWVPKSVHKNIENLVQFYQMYQHYFYRFLGPKSPIYNDQSSYYNMTISHIQTPTRLPGDEWARRYTVAYAVQNTPGIVTLHLQSQTSHLAISIRHALFGPD